MPDALLEPATQPEAEPIESPINSGQDKIRPDSIPLNPARKDHLTRITPEKARLMAQRSAQARSERARLKLNPAPQPALEPAAKPVEADPFVVQALERVRVQLDRINAMLDAESEPALIDKLTSALSRLSDIEQKLAGRPSPGSLRPTDRPAQSRASLLLGLNPGRESGKGRIEQE